MPRRQDPELIRHIAARLRALREARGLTQEALSDASGVQAQTVSRIENEALSPSLPTLAALAAGLRIEFADLVDLKRPLPGPYLSADRRAWLMLLDGLSDGQRSLATKLVTAIRDHGD